MKKLIAFAGLMLMVALAAITASPLPLLASTPAAWNNFVLLGVDPNVSGVTAYADEHKRDLIATLVNGLDIAQDITVIPNVKNKIALPKLSVGNGFRPYSSTTEFKNDQVVIADRYLEVALGKREVLLDVKELQGKHLAWRTSPGSRAAKNFNDLDFAPFVWQEIIRGVQREINDETAYFGFDKSTAVAYSEAATYTNNSIVTFTVNGVSEYFQNISGSTTTAGQDPIDTPAKWRNVTARAVAPGLKSFIDAAIAGGFSVTTTGVINSGATAVAAFKKLFRDMPVPYKNAGVIIHCSFTDFEFLLDGQLDVYKYTVADVSTSPGVQLYGTGGKCFVKPASWLGTSRRLIAEPMVPGTMMGANLVMGTDLLSDANDIKMNENLWTMEAGISLAMGFQISDLSALRLGDQA
jgi:hypothetical protein